MPTFISRSFPSTLDIFLEFNFSTIIKISFNFIVWKKGNSFYHHSAITHIQHIAYVMSKQAPPTDSRLFMKCGLNTKNERKTYTHIHIKWVLMIWQTFFFLLSFLVFVYNQLFNRRSISTAKYPLWIINHICSLQGVIIHLFIC